MYTRDMTLLGLPPFLLDLTSHGRQAIPDTIGAARVQLVGSWSGERVMGHVGVVPNIEIDQLHELREALE